MTSDSAPPSATPYGTLPPASAPANTHGDNLGKMPRFVHNLVDDAGSGRGAMEAYVYKGGNFPLNATHAW